MNLLRQFYNRRAKLRPEDDAALLPTGAKSEFKVGDFVRWGESEYPAARGYVVKLPERGYRCSQCGASSYSDKRRSEYDLPFDYVFVTLDGTQSGSGTLIPTESLVLIKPASTWRVMLIPKSAVGAAMYNVVREDGVGWGSTGESEPGIRLPRAVAEVVATWLNNEAGE